jgi:hypothetical protein
MHLGAIPFSIYNTSAPDQIRYLFTNADNKIVVTEKDSLPAVQAAGTLIYTSGTTACGTTYRHSMDRVTTCAPRC